MLRNNSNQQGFGDGQEFMDVDMNRGENQQALVEGFNGNFGNSKKVTLKEGKTQIKLRRGMVLAIRGLNPIIGRGITMVEAEVVVMVMEGGTSFPVEEAARRHRKKQRKVLVKALLWVLRFREGSPMNPYMMGLC
jgi:hypothetical protein